MSYLPRVELRTAEIIFGSSPESLFGVNSVNIVHQSVHLHKLTETSYPIPCSYLDLLINPDSCNLISPRSGHSGNSCQIRRKQTQASCLYGPGTLKSIGALKGFSYVSNSNLCCAAGFSPRSIMCA